MVLGIMELGIMVLGIMVLGIMVLGIMVLGYGGGIWSDELGKHHLLPDE